MVRVVSWNMNNWQQSRANAASPTAGWDYLRTTLEADVALVQEATLPTEFEPAGYVGEVNDLSGRGWGTGIVDLTGVGIEQFSAFASPDLKTQMTLSQSVPGAVAAAYVGEGADRFIAISIYGQFVGGSSYASMLRHAADLAPLLNNFSAAAKLLIAGDFNLNAQWVDNDTWYNDIEQRILDTFTMWDLRDLIVESDLPAAINCRCGRSICRHVQTYWKKGSATPWQNDHALAGKTLPVIQVWVDSSAVTEHSLSDHAPVVIDVGVPAIGN